MNKAEPYEQWLDKLDRQKLFKKINMRRYGYVLVVVCLLGLQNQVFAFGTAGETRKKVFTKEFITEHVEATHK